MTWSLFIDDTRFPKNSVDVIARNYKETFELIEGFGYPYFISFDHDLGTPETGLTIAKELVQQDLNINWMSSTFDFNVHSQNPVGKENIEKYLVGYLDQKYGAEWQPANLRLNQHRKPML